MSAGKYNITIQENATYMLPIQIRESVSQLPVDLTGSTVAAAIKERFGDDVPSIVDFDVEYTDLTGGCFTISIDAAVTADLPNFGTGVWDLLVTTASGQRIRYLQGKAFFSQGVAV